MSYDISLKYVILGTVVLLQKLSESTTVNCDAYKANTTVQGPPVMTMKGDKVIYKMWHTGNSGYLHCCTSGNPSPTITWFKDGHEIDLLNIRLILRSNNQTLLITPLKLADSGMYSCQSTNRFGNESRKFNVDVKSSLVFQKPVVILKPGSWSAVAHSNVTFHCIVKKSARKPLVLWYLNSTSTSPLNFRRHGQYFVSKTKQMDEDQTWMSNLTIKNVTVSDRGVYICEAKNGAGSGKTPEDSGVLTIQEPTEKTSLKTEQTKTTTDPAGPLTVVVTATIVTLATAVLIIVAILLYRKKHSRTPGIIQDGNHPMDPSADRLINVDVGIPLVGNFDCNDKVVFDVFISYSSQDRDFVKNILFDELSTTHSVCIDFKDFEAGLYIGDNIWNSIFRSKKTLLVVSRNFLSGVWTHFEMQIAQGRLAQGQDVLIPVIIENIAFDELPKPLQYYRQTKTYLEYFNEDVRPHFWNRLRSTLGPSLREYQDNSQQAEVDASNNV